MVSTLGTVKHIKVGKPGADGTGTQAEELILWFSGPPITAPQWILNNASLQILRDAYTNRTPITVTTNDSSAIVTAPGASIVVYFAPIADFGFIDALSTAIQAADQPCCVSVSWGGAEVFWTNPAMATMNGFLEDAAALGLPVFISAGDRGSGDGVGDGKQHANFPASAPFALACGGTRLESADAVHIDNEVVWNDDSGATGGGVSDVFALPDWQAGAGVPPTVNPGNFQGRGLPDVAGDASQDTGISIRVDGDTGVTGGTSAVAPMWAGLTARMSQYLGVGGMGLSADLLYSDTQARQAFHDITSGNNGAYSAAPGWDPRTGWGGPDGEALLTVLGNWNFTQWQI